MVATRPPRLDLGPFLEELLDKSLPMPTYYRYMAMCNRAGPEEPEYTPVPMVDARELAEMLVSGTPVVDLRPRRQFADAHCRGTLIVGLRSQPPDLFRLARPFLFPFFLWWCHAVRTSSWRPRVCSRGWIGRCQQARRQADHVGTPDGPAVGPLRSGEFFEHWGSVIDGAGRRM